MVQACSAGHRLKKGCLQDEAVGPAQLRKGGSGGKGSEKASGLRAFTVTAAAIVNSSLEEGGSVCPPPEDQPLSLLLALE